MANILDEDPIDVTFEYRPSPIPPKVGDIIEFRLPDGEVLEARVESMDEDELTGETTLHMVSRHA